MPATTGARRPDEPSAISPTMSVKNLSGAQPFARAGYARNQRIDISEVETDNEEVRHRIGDRLADQRAQAIILGRQHLPRRREDLWPRSRHPCHPRQHMARADRQGSTPPGDLVLFRDARVEGGGFRRRAIVRPCDCWRERRAVGPDEYVRVGLAAEADRGHSLRPVADEKRVHRSGDALRPVARVLLDDARRRARGRIRTAHVSDKPAIDVEQRPLDGRGPDVEPEKKVAPFSHRVPPASLSAAPPVPPDR